MSGETNAPTTGNANKEGSLEKVKIWLPTATSVFMAVVGFFIWNAQTAIQERVDVNSILLQRQLDKQNQMELDQHKSQLALKEAYYKRRLEVYERACAQITEMEKSLADVGVTNQTQKHATDAVIALHSFRKGYKLYWSPPLDQRLEELWELGVKKLKPSEGPASEQLNEEINREIAELHAQMKTDLQLDPGGAKPFPLQDAGKKAQEKAGGTQETK